MQAKNTTAKHGPLTDITHYHGQDEPEAHAIYPCGDDGCPYYIDNIVRAVNNHDALLAALEQMTPDYEHCAPDEAGHIDPDRIALVKRARAACAAARAPAPGCPDPCPDGSDCPCFQAGYETPREPLR